MENEEQMAEISRVSSAKGGAWCGGPEELKRRSTSIGHRFGHRGPLVLKATLTPGDVNTQVGFGPRPSAVWLLISRMHRSLCAGDALDRRLGRGAPTHITPPDPDPDLELRTLTTAVPVARALAEP